MSINKLNVLLATSVGLLCSFSSPAFGDPPDIPYERIELKCLSSLGGQINFVVRTNEDFEALVSKYHTKPLKEYWDQNYPSTLKAIKERFPDKSDEEHQETARRRMYEFAPFIGKEHCSLPVIDFQKYTLLGQAAYAGGCRMPDYTISLTRYPKTREIVFSVEVVQLGMCDMLRGEKIWLLVPKLDVSESVRFEKKIVPSATIR